MERCLMTIRRDYHGCTLLRNGLALAWYPRVEHALALAWALAEACNLRDGSTAEIEIRHPTGSTRRLPHPG